MQFQQSTIVGRIVSGIRRINRSNLCYLVISLHQSDALASPWDCPKTKLRRENEKEDIPLCRNTVLALCLYPKAWSSEVLPVRLPERSPGRLPEISTTMFRMPFGYLRRHAPQYHVIICQCHVWPGVLFYTVEILPRPSSGLFFLQVRFVFLSFILFTFPFSLHHMSSGSQTVGDAVVPNFDMHVYTSVLTSDEIKSLVAEYAIPLDLHPCVPPSSLTMNKLPTDKIGSLVIIRTSLGEKGSRQDFQRVLHESQALEGPVFFIDRRAIPDAMPWRHQDSSVADPTPTGVRAEDIRRLCKNVIDLRPVHPAMLYAMGLTTIWKHVGHHPVFKNGEGMVATTNEVIPQHTTPPLPFSTQISEKSDHQKVVEYENERVLAAKQKAQAAKDRAVGKRAATEGTSQRTKKKKMTPFSFALSDSEVDRSNRSGFGTHHSASPLNTIIPNEIELTTGGDDLILESVNRTEDDTEHHLDNVEDTTEAHYPLFEHPPRSQHSNPSAEDAHHTRDETAHIYASRTKKGRAIKQWWEAELAAKTSLLTEAESCFAPLLDLLSSDDIKKFGSCFQCGLFATGWSEGAKAACSEEEAKAFLATATDYDPAYKTTFMFEFGFLCNKSYPMVEKLVDPSGFFRVHASLYTCMFLCVAWPLAHGLIRRVLHFGYCKSLGHWLLDSSETSCVTGIARHLAIGSWTHPERLAFRVLYVTWLLALGLIQSVKHFSG
ncbi:hypothetical protein Tco_0143411 [Tanacetum coccineum]